MSEQRPDDGQPKETPELDELMRRLTTALADEGYSTIEADMDVVRANTGPWSMGLVLRERDRP